MGHVAYGQATVLMRRGGGLAPAGQALVTPYLPGTSVPYSEPLYGAPDGSVALTFPQATGEDGVVALWADAPARLELEASHPLLGRGRVTVDIEWPPDVDEPQYATDEDLAAHIAAPDPHSQYATDVDLAAHTGAADPHSQYAADTDLAAHTAGVDPHSQYATDADLAAHAGAPDPHPQYAADADLAGYLTPEQADDLFLTPAEGDLRYAPLGTGPGDVYTKAESDALFLDQTEADNRYPLKTAVDPYPQYLTDAELTAALASLTARVAALEASVAALRTHQHALTSWSQGTAAPTGGIP